ncbi:MAG: hypothetical protein QXE51_03295 [Nitrososphaeria archaeon]
MRIRKIKLTESNLMRMYKIGSYIKRFGLTCYKCKKIFAQNEVIVSKIMGSGRTKYYCLDCAKKLYFIKS